MWPGVHPCGSDMTCEMPVFLICLAPLARIIIYIVGPIQHMLRQTSRTEPTLASQVCDLETVLTIERARAEEAEKATARAERCLKQAIKGARCISHMCVVSHCPA